MCSLPSKGSVMRHVRSSLFTNLDCPDSGPDALVWDTPAKKTPSGGMGLKDRLM
jgi:hypothetical protein